MITLVDTDEEISATYIVNLLFSKNAFNYNLKLKTLGVMSKPPKVLVFCLMLFIINKKIKSKEIQITLNLL